MHLIDSKTVYEWFYLEPINTRTVSRYYDDFELSDEEYKITRTDAKIVLRLMRSGNYSFRQIDDWVNFFFDFVNKIPSESELVKEQVGYIIYKIWNAVGMVLDDKEKDDAEAADLFPYLDELMEIHDLGRTHDVE